jgi:hypothetical protein
VHGDILQDRFQERWNAGIVPKLRDELTAQHNEEMSMRKHLLESLRQQESVLLDTMCMKLLELLEVCLFTAYSLCDIDDWQFPCTLFRVDCYGNPAVVLLAYSQIVLVGLCVLEGGSVCL